MPALIPSRWGRRRPLLVLLAALAAAVALLFGPLEAAVLAISQVYATWLTSLSGGGGWAVLALPLLAFGGGLLASVSPCVLALLPVQLSYLGAQKQQRPHPGKVVQFTLGVITAYSVLGLFTSLAGALIIDHRGGLFTATGVLMIVMALQLQGWGPRLPWHRLTPGPFTGSSWLRLVPSGSFLIGLTFALVTSPCASPVLAAVLGAAAAASSPPLAVAAMLLYAMGYSAVILLAGLGVELGGVRRRLLERGEGISSISALVLLAFGTGYLWSGLRELAQQVPV